jgi:hypothetical protein
VTEEDVPTRQFRQGDLTRWLLSRVIATGGEQIRSIRALPPGQSELVARRLFDETEGANDVANGMGERGLLRSFERSLTFTAFSHSLAATKTVTVIPFSSPDPHSVYVGGLGISEGQPANGVVVELQGTQLLRFTTLDFLEGEYSERTFELADLMGSGIDAYVEERDREAIEPHLPVSDSINLATHAFRVLVTDDHSLAIHSSDDVGEFMHQLPIISMIAELQYQRLRGLHTTSITMSCCSCCCCCWGCCSSCSAVSSAYVNHAYYASTG